MGDPRSIPVLIFCVSILLVGQPRGLAVIQVLFRLTVNFPSYSRALFFKLQESLVTFAMLA